MYCHNNGRRHTDEDEAEGDAEGEDVATEGLVVLAVALGEHAQPGVDVVFAQSLWKQSVRCVFTYRFEKKNIDILLHKMLIRIYTVVWMNTLF